MELRGRRHALSAIRSAARPTKRSIASNPAARNEPCRTQYVGTSGSSGRTESPTNRLEIDRFSLPVS